MTGVKLYQQQFITIPAGIYHVGITPGEARSIIKQLPGTMKPDYIYHSVPSHTINIREFNIYDHPVSTGLFHEFVSDTGYMTEAEIEGWGWTWEKGWKKKNGLTWQFPFGNEADALYRQDPEKFPVLQVSCNDAMAFCNWLSQKTGTRYRLPLEEEWEVFAAKMDVPGMGDSVMIETREVPETTVDFMHLLENHVNRNDSMMPGMAWEWTSSWFDAYPGGAFHEEYGTTYRVLRGGSLMSNNLQKTRQYRFRRCPTARSPFYCFRILF